MSDQPSPPWSTDAWRKQGGRSWLARADGLEAMLAPILEPLFACAALRPGEHVLDVGCGRGATAYRAAATVGADGAVTAVDVSAELIDAARHTAPGHAPDGAASVEWLVADAQRADLAGRDFDAVISRFGVMFFDDAVEAFTNLRLAARHEGRLVVATWQPRDACDFQSVGWQAITERLIAEGYDVPETDPVAGPYAFGVESHVRSTLAAAGWHDVTIHPVTLPLYYGGPGVSTQVAVETAMTMAGTRRFLDSFDEHAAGLAAEALLQAYEVRHDGTGVRLEAAILISTASA